MRPGDEPTIPPDVHHWLNKLDQEISGLRTGLNDLTRDVSANRIVLAELSARTGRVPISLILVMMGLILTLGIQTALGMNWGGRMQVMIEQGVRESSKGLALIEQHIATAGPVREAVPRLERDVNDLEARLRDCSNRQAVVIQRLDKIEERNKIADANWAKMAAKGYLIERTDAVQRRR